MALCFNIVHGFILPLLYHKTILYVAFSDKDAENPHTISRVSIICLPFISRAI